MSTILELPDELADTLATEAAQQGMSLPDYAISLLKSERPSLASIKSGADLVAYWQAAGVIGSRPDILDSQAEARVLRERAQKRGI